MPSYLRCCWSSSRAGNAKSTSPYLRKTRDPDLAIDNQFPPSHENALCRCRWARRRTRSCGRRGGRGWTSRRCWRWRGARWPMRTRPPGSRRCAGPPRCWTGTGHRWAGGRKRTVHSGVAIACGVDVLLCCFCVVFYSEMDCKAAEKASGADHCAFSCTRSLSRPTGALPRSSNPIKRCMEAWR
jgi:hypothetical protein